MIGTTLGHYRVVEKRAEVYPAEDTKLGRRVALRFLPPDLVADAARLERFEDETRAVAALNHPNIVNIYSIEEADGVRFLTLELVEGTPLAEAIPKGGLPLEDLLKLAVPLVDAVACAHEHGIVHGALRPANIMVAGDGRLKVLEFGLATLRTPGAAAERPAMFAAADEATTGAGAADATMNASAATGATATAVGTDATYLSTQLAEQRAADGEPFAYLSPEQAEGRPVDHRSDIFSLGVVLYEMACGQQPFKGDTPVSLLSAILKDTPVPASRVNRALPPALDRVIARAVTKDPSARYPSARELHRDLQQLAERSTSRRLGLSLLRVVARSRWARRLALAAGVIVVVGAATWTLAPRRVRREAASAAASLRFRVEQLTAEPGVEQFPSFTPDGKSVVYAGQQSGNWDIYSRSLSGQTAPINLTADSPADDNEPAVSPDGSRIAFRSSRDGGGIFVMGRAGGAVTRVTRPGRSHVYNPAWSPDGTEMAFTTEDVQLTPLNWERPSELWIVTLNTGAERRLPADNVVQAAWSPHGHRLAYASRAALFDTGGGTQGGTRVMDVWTVPASGGTPVAVTNDPQADWSPTWSPDGRYLYFVSDRGGGGMNLWRVAIDEVSGRTLGPLQPVTTPAQFLAHPVVSPDGRTIAYCAKTETGNIGKIRLDPASAIVQGEMTWVTTGSLLWSNPDPSWDGESIVAYTREQPEGDLYIIPADGSGRPRQLTSEPQFVDRLPRWSPDKKWITFFSTRENAGTDLYKIRPDGSGCQLVGPRGGLHAWSPDGARLAVSQVVIGTTEDERTTSVMDTGRAWDAQTPEVLPRPEGEIRRFIVQDWSPDGARLVGQLGFSASGRGDGLVVYSFATRKYERVSEFGEWPVWLPDSRRVLFVTGGKEFWVVDTRTKEKRKIYSVARGLGPARLTRDGRLAFFPLRLLDADIYLLRFER